MLRTSLKFKIIMPTVTIFAVLVITINAFLSIRFSALSNTLINEKLIASTNSLKLYLTESMAISRAAAASMALNPEAVKAIKERDRNAILKAFSPMLELYRINLCTICDNEGNALARVHAPDSFGDSILDQQNIQDALQGKVSSYFEEGTVTSVSVRTGIPVYDTDGALVGVVSAGVRFDLDSEVEKLKNLFNSDVTVFLGETRIATTITKNGQSIVGTTLDPRIAEIVLKNKQEYLGDVDVFGDKYRKYYLPLLNSKNEAFAAFVLSIPGLDIITELNKSIRDGILIGLGGLIVSIALLYFIISTISKPIIVLSNDMNQIADGNLRIDIDVKTRDEVSYLGKSLQKIVKTLHKLLNDINTMIIEQKNGNTDYCLNADDFNGDYKKLADSVLDLAAFGMRDQLTGIPNRRSFDYRVNWEWKRAIREKSPLSILMIDVDKFKNYNDSFGHQQGDVALQTIAKTIKQTVKRMIDFVARWGGEEFIVLLPTTDSAGAICVAEKIRAEIENMIIPCADERGNKITISIGVSTQIPTAHNSHEHTISMADSALYKAKEAGRNRAVYLGDDTNT